jgi:hypothetical protein
MTLTAILPDSGFSNGRLTVLYKLLQAASSISARSARLSLSYGSSAPVSRVYLLGPYQDRQPLSGWQDNSTC